jgi:hypothetical protein
MLQQRLRLLGPLSSFAVRQLAERLLIFAGYLHSEESSSLNLSLERSEAGKSKLVLQSDLNPSVSKSVKRILRFLMRNAMKLGGIPLSPLLRIMDPGTSYHYGGSFPMSLEPRSAFESDRWGRPRGLARTFIVDASNFPTMPASNLTVNAMANAHRIATAALRELP